MRTGLDWLQRAAYHLRMDKRELLDADDAAAFRGATEAITTLDRLGRELKAIEYTQRQQRRAEVQRLRAINEGDKRLQSRLSHLAGTFLGKAA